MMKSIPQHTVKPHFHAVACILRFVCRRPLFNSTPHARRCDGDDVEKEVDDMQRQIQKQQKKMQNNTNLVTLTATTKITATTTVTTTIICKVQRDYF